MTEERSVRLFSYGTLRYRDVQLATFGRELDGEPDVLPGYTRGTVAITDPDVIAKSGEATHPMTVRTGNPADGVEGIVFALTPAELEAADGYEVDAYKRVSVRLRSGVEAFVYVDARD